MKKKFPTYNPYGIWWTLAIIVHCTVQFNVYYCKRSVSDMGPNTILKIKNIIIRRLKSEITQISNIQSFLKFSRPLAIIVCYTLQFNLECCKSPVSDMGPNTIFLKFIIRRLESEIKKKSNIQSLYLVDHLLS